MQPSPLIPTLALLLAATAGSVGFAADAAEVSAKRGAHHQKMLERFDTNHDGKIDHAERIARREAYFTKLDTNGDGSLSRDEFVHRHHGKKGKEPGAG